MWFSERGSNAAATVCDALCGANCVELLERELSASFSRETVAMCSHDAALHTALWLCGARRGDYVFVPSFTFYSYIATVTNLGCVPVFLDADPHTRCVSPSALETALVWARLQGKAPKAVMVDNAFGSVADYDVLTPLCKSFDVPMIELCCDCSGGTYRQKPCGAFGDYGIIALNKRPNGGGGAIVCGEDAQKAREFALYSFSLGERHDYRLHNIVAALDISLLPEIKKITARAKRNYETIKSCEDVCEATDGDAAYYALVKCVPDKLTERGFTVKQPPPVHKMHKYSGYAFFEHEPNYSVCDVLSEYRLVDLDFPRRKARTLKKLLEK